jgi:phage terminase large subunit-like protein
VDWLLPRLVELTRKHRCSIVLQRTGPLGYLCDELARAGVQVTAVSGAEYGDAVSRFRTLVSSQQLAHLNDPRLNQAVDAVESSQRGDRPIWKRAKGQGMDIDISPLVAVTLSAWLAATPPVAPRIVTI